MNGSDSILLTCAKCGTKNRIPRNRLNNHPFCGQCHAPLSVGTYVNPPLDISDSEFSQEVLSSPVPVLLEFWSPHCPYCRLIAPAIDQIAAELGDRAKVARMNVERNPGSPSLFAVQGTPTILLFKDGKAVDRMVGVLSREEIERRLLLLIAKS